MKSYNFQDFLLFTMTDRVYNTLRIVLFSLIVVFGGLTLLQYLSVSVHQAVLLSDAGRQAVATACPSGGTLCVGWNALFPFIGQTITWASPFLWFGIWSVIAFLVLLVRTFLRDGEWRVRMNIRPVWLIVTFIGLLWLHFTVIGTGSVDGAPFARLYEPLQQVYAGADAEQLAVLKENFDNLQSHHCLMQVGTTQNGASVFDMSALCMQASFFSRVLPQLLVIVVLLIELLALGRFLLRKLMPRDHHPLTELTFSLGIGAAALITLLWLIAVIGAVINMPIYNMTLGWGLALLLPALLWRDVLYWVRSAWSREWSYDEPWYGGMLPLAWLLIGLLALNFLNVVRPFPIGWDDLGRYLNVPRLLVSYGFFIPQLAAFQWEYLTSLGFLLFGYDSIFAATASMMINWSAGLIAVLVVYAFTRRMMGPKHGLLATFLYYVLPMVGHFSFADMKVDNAVFLMGALSVFALFITLFPQQSEDTDEAQEDQSERTLDWRWLTVCGVLAGFAFGFKPTTIMTFFAIGTMLFGARVHWTAFLGTIALAWVVYVRDNRFNVTDIAQRVYGNPEALNKSVIMISLLVLGLGLTAYSAFLRPSVFRKTARSAGLIIGTFFLAIAPWMLANNISYGNIIPRLVFTAPNNLTPIITPGKEEVDAGSQQVVRTLPPALQVDMTKCTNTSKSEELDRYWGYGSGWSHYFGLPFRAVMNADSAGYYVTTYPALLLFPLLLLLPYFWRKKEGRWLRWLFAGTLFMILQWIFFANGILWYGVGMFLGIVVGLEALTLKSPDLPSKISMSILVGLSIMIGFSNRFWQFDQQKNLFEYPLGKVSADAMRERTIPYYDDIRDEIERRALVTPTQPYVYRMGTFIPYFVPKNLEVIPVGDQQLDFFNCLFIERDAQLTLRRLQILGFNSMIFDTNTDTIEQDPNGSLHQKVKLFVDFVNTPGLGLSVPINDTNAGIAFILIPDLPAGSGSTIVPAQQ